MTTWAGCLMQHKRKPTAEMTFSGICLCLDTSSIIHVLDRGQMTSDMPIGNLPDDSIACPVRSCKSQCFERLPMCSLHWQSLEDNHKGAIRLWHRKTGKGSPNWLRHVALAAETFDSVS
jgi:hypothetical protein